MNGSLAANNISQIKSEIKKTKLLKDRRKEKYIKELDELHKRYTEVEINQKYKTQYNKMNSKGVELIKELKTTKDHKAIESGVEIYIRYLKASMCDFNDKTINLRKYITSFLFCSMLFLALSPQFYGFFLPILFFLPIYMGLKGVKERTMTGFYMTMSIVPVALMTSASWIRNGIYVINNYDIALENMINSGVSQKLAGILVVAGPVLGSALFIVASMQLYRGIKNKDLFI